MPQNVKQPRRLDTKERRRINQIIKEHNIVTGYTPGAPWELCRQQFQALYRKVGGDFPEAMRLMPRLIRMPGGHSQPPDYVFEGWAQEYDYGVADIAPKIAQVINEKVQNSRMSFLWKTLEVGGDAYQTLAKMSAAGELPQKTQSQLLSLANGFNYSTASIAAMEKVVNANTGPTLHLRGSLSLDAGPAPKKIKRKTVAKLKELPTEAEWRELDDPD